MQRPAAPAEFRVELQGAVDHDEGERRAQAVAVDDDLVGVGLTRDADQFRRKAVEPLLDPRPHAMNEVAREVPIVERIADEQPPAEDQPQRHEERERKQRRPEQGIRQAAVAHDEPREPDRQPDHAENVDERREKEAAVSPRHDEIFDGRAGENELDQGGDAERKAPPVALLRVRRHEVVPAEVVIVRGDAPVRPSGLDRPVRDRAVGGNAERETLPLTFQAFWNRAISRMKRRCWCSTPTGS